MTYPSVVRIALALAGALAAAPVRAEEAPPAPAKASLSDGRTLDGHVFMPTLVVSQPFITTSFASGFRAAAGSTTASYTAGGRTLDGTFNYAGVGGSLFFEYAFLDFLSARISIDEILYSGTTGRSAIVIGTNGQFGAGLGVTGSYLLTPQLRLGVAFDVAVTPNAGLTIGAGIKDIINSCQTTGCDLGAGHFFQQKNPVTYTPAVSAAWSPWLPLGVTASLGFEWARATTANQGTLTGQAVVLATAVDFDFLAISPVAVGVNLQLRWNAPTSSDNVLLQHVTDLGGGIFYTGRKNLSAGVQIIDRQFAVTPDVRVSWKTFVTEIGLRYYW
jgi:hypothetical protein